MIDFKHKVENEWNKKDSFKWNKSGLEIKIINIQFKFPEKSQFCGRIGPFEKCFENHRIFGNWARFFKKFEI